MVPGLASGPESPRRQIGEQLPDDLWDKHVLHSLIPNVVSVYLSEAGSVDRLHAVLAAEVDVVEVDDVPRDADALRQLVVPLCRFKM